MPPFLPGAPRRVLMDSLGFRKQLVPGEIIKDLLLEVFDEFCNHVKENELINLQLDGFCIQDKRGLAFKMPILINAGSPLENLVFEVVNTDGEVDKGIHSEEHNGQRHTLQIRSDSLDLDDPPEYSFYLGRCTVQEIPIPQKERKFCFKAAYSHHPELNLNVEVHILKQLQMEHENIPSQISDEKILSCASYGNPHQSADKGLLLLSDSSEPLAVCDLSNSQPEMTHKNVPSQSSEGKYLRSSEPSKVDHYVNGPHKYAERGIFLLPDSSTS